MKNIIGLITAWGAKDWIDLAIRQAFDCCDEVIVSVSSHSPELERFRDETYDICKKYDDIILLDYNPREFIVSKNRCKILNDMLGHSNLYYSGNWIWMLDVDEFYPRIVKDVVKSIVELDEYEAISFNEAMFFVNMQRYLKGVRTRVFKIKNDSDCFTPTNRWNKPTNNIYYFPIDIGMFHYSMLTNINIHKVRWATEFSNTRQEGRTKWLDEIYMKYDLEEERRWINKNFYITGTRSPWFNIGFKSDDGFLFKYDGKHPEIIEHSGLTSIKDFRKLYV